MLDVGCGTAILSMFCVKAGAKHVYAIDMSNIIDQARDIVQLNGMADQITLIKGKMEEIQLPVEKVDIIVSEWMGYFLLYESMLETVLYARDQYLAPNGLLFPDKASIYVAGIEDADYKEEKIGFWKDVYGFNFSPIQAIALREPLADTVELRTVVTEPCHLLTLDLKTCRNEDCEFKNAIKLVARRDDYVHALIAWFDIEFGACHKPVRFSTGPHAKYTHWKQTVFYLPTTVTIKEGEQIEGTLACKPNEGNKRDLDLSLDISFAGQLQQFSNLIAEYRM